MGTRGDCWLVVLLRGGRELIRSCAVVEGMLPFRTERLDGAKAVILDSVCNIRTC